MSVEVIRQAIPLTLCRAAEAAWPSIDWPYWHRYKSANADKFGSMDRSRIPPACLAALDALALAVIPHIGDSFIDYDLHAAGLHMLPPRGFLGRHLDAVCHPIREWKRTHSIVAVVNSEWKEHHGGRLIIDGEMSLNIECGNAVVFTTEDQWHSVSPVGDFVYRKSLALFAWQEATCSGSSVAEFCEQ